MGVMAMPVVNVTTDPCLHCQGELKWGLPDGIEISTWNKPLWFHTVNGKRACPLPDDPGGISLDHRAKPIHYCDAKVQEYNAICNRPVREYGKCGIHSKDAKAEWEREQAIKDLERQDQYVEEALGSIIQHWNEFYDLDAKLQETQGWNDYKYRIGQARYTGYVVVNPARFAELLKKIEEEF